MVLLTLMFLTITRFRGHLFKASSYELRNPYIYSFVTGNVTGNEAEKRMVIYIGDGVPPMY